MEPRADDDGTLSDLPWASVFDPAANVRALGEIQARGLRAAGDVVDRMVRAIDGDGAAATRRSETTTEDHQRAPDAVLASWATLAQELVTSLRGALGDDGHRDAPSLDVGEGRSSGRVTLAVDDTGTARAEVWVHNRSADALGCVRLRCSDLLAHDGRVIAGSEVGFDPVEVPVPPRSSRGIEVTTVVPPKAATGGEPAVFRGVLVVADHPALWLPVSLVVDAPATSPST